MMGRTVEKTDANVLEKNFYSFFEFLIFLFKKDGNDYEHLKEHELSQTKIPT